MSAVLLAVFDDLETAEGAAWRCSVTASLPTASSSRHVMSWGAQRVSRPSCSMTDSRILSYAIHARRGTQHAHRLADRVEQGAAAIAVLPRGDIEVRRAAELLGHAHPDELLDRDLQAQSWEFAAAPHDLPWVRTLWVESGPDAPHCVYCRLFPATAHESH